jgi:hypothetical protein
MATVQRAPCNNGTQLPAYLWMTHLPACLPLAVGHLLCARRIQFHTSQGTGPCLCCYNYKTLQKKTANGLRQTPKIRDDSDQEQRFSDRTFPVASFGNKKHSKCIYVPINHRVRSNTSFLNRTEVKRSVGSNSVLKKNKYDFCNLHTNGDILY